MLNFWVEVTIKTSKTQWLYLKPIEAMTQNLQDELNTTKRTASELKFTL